VRTPAAPLAAALAALALAPSPVAAVTLADLEAEQTALFDRIAPAVVVVTAGDAAATGFAVAPDLVLTNAHVVGAATEVTVTFQDGRTTRARVEERGPGGLDLAALRLPVKAPATLPLAAEAPLRPGAFVATVGHADGVSWTFATGMVASTAPPGGAAALVKLQLPLRRGASGGPVVDRTGRVVGIVSLGGGGVVYAIRARAAAAALRAVALRPAAVDDAPLPARRARAEARGAEVDPEIVELARRAEARGRAPASRVEVGEPPAPGGAPDDH
jgi:S1-C subfamily serine protease